MRLLEGLPGVDLRIVADSTLRVAPEDPDIMSRGGAGDRADAS